MADEPLKQETFNFFAALFALMPKGFTASLGEFLGNLLKPIIVEIVNERIKDTAEVSKPNADLNADFDLDTRT
jgi:hypothetical protein